MAEDLLRGWRPYVFPRGRRLDGWFDRAAPGAARLRVPTIEAEEQDDACVVTAAVPGAAKEELTISFEAGVLRVAGAATAEAEAERRRHHPHDAFFRSFSREIRIDKEIDLSRTEALFSDGVLTVRLPYAASAREVELEAFVLQVS